MKIFTGSNKAHIKTGFGQSLLYSNNYNSPTGFLVVFNVSDKELKFNTTSSELPQRINFSGKTIFIITISIYPHEEPASTRTLEVYEISEEYLVS